MSRCEHADSLRGSTLAPMPERRQKLQASLLKACSAGRQLYSPPRGSDCASTAVCRMAVAYVFPMFMLPVSLVRAGIVFKRGSIADKDVSDLVLSQACVLQPVC